MAYGITVRMWSTTGMGCAKNRALAFVTSALLASSASLAVPAIAGTRLRRISMAGTSQSDRLEVLVGAIVGSRLARDESQASHHHDIVAGACRALAGER